MNKKNVRWHDKKPELARAIHFLASLPNDVQSIIGECVIKVAERNYKVSEIMKDLKSLGTEKIMGLHQSQKKRRSYDKNPATQKAVNHIYVLPESEQNKLAKQVLSLMDCVFHYFETHQILNVPVEKQTLQGLADAFAEGGLNQAKAFNTTLRKQLQLGSKSVEQVQEGEQGLLIRQKTSETL